MKPDSAALARRNEVIAKIMLTSAFEEEVAEWSAPLKPTEMGNDWSCNTGKKPAAAPDPTHGMKVFTLWWD